MISFKNDYSGGAHPALLEALSKTNHSQEEGYGQDQYSQAARRLLEEKIGNKDHDILFVSGGSQANLIAVSSLLRPYQAAVAAQSGHINSHEAGAVEGSGHKILTIESPDGKVRIQDIESILSAHTDVHTVQPKLVYISNPTELGTVYSAKELASLYSFCQKKGLTLYCDGARLGQTLVLDKDPLSLADYGRYTDAFFMGGTKNGALLGEALLLKKNPDISLEHMAKRTGGLLAKGRILGASFQALMTDGLYERLAKKAQDLAQKIRKELEKEGVTFLTDSYTNQIFPLLDNTLIKTLEKEFSFYVWQTGKRQSAIRLVTAWDTEQKDVDQLIERVTALLEE